MTLLDPGKFRLLGLIIIGGFGLAFAGLFVHEPAALAAGVGMVTGVAGYLHGNGRLAASGNAPTPVIGRPEQLDMSVNQGLTPTSQQDGPRHARQGGSEDYRS